MYFFLNFLWLYCFYLITILASQNIFLNIGTKRKKAIVLRSAHYTDIWTPNEENACFKYSTVSRLEDPGLNKQMQTIAQDHIQNLHP